MTAGVFIHWDNGSLPHPSGLKPLTAAGDFDEAKHPRGEHGRFAPTGELRATQSTKFREWPGTGKDPALEVAHQLLTVRPDGSHSGGTSFHGDLREQALAKQTAARDIAARMTSDPIDMIRTMYPHGMGSEMGQGQLEKGAAADKARADLIAEAQVGVDPQEKADWGDLAGGGKYVTTADVLERLQSTDGMLARPISSTSADGSERTRISWLDPSGIDLTPADEAELKATGYVPARDPSVDDAIKQAGASQMIAQWAGTANNASAWALSMQDTATEMFGLKGTETWDTSLLAPEGRTYDEYHADVIPMQRDFLQAMYTNTQDYLAANNVKEVTLERGFEWYSASEVPGWAKQQGAQDIALRPISSWTANPATADQFGGHDELDHPEGSNSLGAVIDAVVPADRILSTARTGVGCLTESEYTVLGGREEVHVQSIATAAL